MDIRGRRWFRFSLGSLLLIIAVLSVWLASIANRVRERQTLADEILARGGVIDNQSPHMRQGADYHTATGPKHEAIPRLWLLMGAKPLQKIMIPIGEFSIEERWHMRAVFPELAEDGLGLPSKWEQEHGVRLGPPEIKRDTSPAPQTP